MSDQTPAKDLAATILTQLGQDFAVPAIDLSDAKYQLPSESGNPLYDPVNAPDISDLTDGTVGGSGAFDKIMSSHLAHLRDQFDKGLITGQEYTKTYIELTATAMSAGLQMVIAADQARWQSILIQNQAKKAEIDAVRAKVELETAKYQLAAQQAQAKILKAQDVLTQMQIAGEDAKYNLVHEQMHLVQEQREAAHAQTQDTLTDGVTPVTGAIGKQKDLHNQQITSYQRDSELKVAKLFTDAWVTQKTLDDALLAPAQFQNAEVDEVLVALRQNVGLGS